MKIKALKPFTMNANGDLTSIACGAIANVTDSLGAQLISDGLAEAYTLVSPEGTKTINANGTYDVTQYASATVNVGTLTITYNANGGTGTVASQTVISGNSVELSDGTGLTAPANKVFVGWATTSTATESDVTSPYTPSANVTLYAVYGDE